MASSSSSSSQNQCDLPRFYYCYCGARMYVRTSWTNKNPARRFVKCPDVKTQYCCEYRFLDVVLPSNYYKKVVYELRLQSVNQSMISQMASGNTQNGSEATDANLLLLKKMEELTLCKSKLKMFDQVFLVLVVVVFMLCFVI